MLYNQPVGRLHSSHICNWVGALAHSAAHSMGLQLLYICLLIFTQWICNYHLFVFCNRIITSNSTPRVRIHSLCENSIFFLITKKLLMIVLSLNFESGEWSKFNLCASSSFGLKNYNFFLLSLSWDMRSICSLSYIKKSLRREIYCLSLFGLVDIVHWSVFPEHMPPPHPILLSHVPQSLGKRDATGDNNWKMGQPGHTNLEQYVFSSLWIMWGVKYHKSVITSLTP